MSYLSPYIITPKKELQPIPENVKEHAGFIQQAFKKPEERPLTHPYGQYVGQFSNDLLATYYKPETKEFNVALRGTDLTDFSRGVKDLKTDIGLLSGNVKGDPQYRQSYDIVRKIRKNQINQGIKPNINLYGFSLGGGVAKQLTNDITGIKSVSLNPFSFRDKDPENSFTYRIKGDVISSGSDVGKTRVFESPSFYSHGLRRFLD